MYSLLCNVGAVTATDNVADAIADNGTGPSAGAGAICYFIQGKKCTVPRLYFI